MHISCFKFVTCMIVQTYCKYIIYHFTFIIYTQVGILSHFTLCVAHFCPSALHLFSTGCIFSRARMANISWYKILFVKGEANRSYLNTDTSYICICTVTYMSSTKMETVKQTHSMFLHAKTDMEHVKQNPTTTQVLSYFSIKLSWNSVV